MSRIAAVSAADRPGFSLAVGALSAAVIAAQIGVMRIFAIGSWVHFGSLVIGIAMASFGLASAVMSVSPAFFERRAATVATVALLAFGPLLVLGNAGAQALGFNPIFLAAGSGQFWVLLGVVGYYFLPFFAAAMFLGSAFLIGAERFGRVYFADLFGAGLAGLLFLGALALVPPRYLLLVPLAFWLAASLAWAGATVRRLTAVAAAVLAVVTVAFGISTETISISSYKGVAYARHYPDAKLLYENWGPQGDLEIYASSYFHFAPGLSDMAAVDLATMPEDSYLGMYIDGDGPIGVMKSLSDADQAYFRYLPMALPYLIRPDARTFVVQFGGGVSTRVALGLGAKSVVAAEPNPLIRRALTDPGIVRLTGNVLGDPRVTVLPTEGRIALVGRDDAFDVIDLSLVDSTGLSSPGGLSVTEKYAYTEEAMERYMRALKPDGVLSVTVWNKENPPKAVPRLFATLIAAARAVDPGPVEGRFFAVHAYLSTATFLYRRSGFTDAELAALQDQAKHLAFDVIWAPGQTIDPAADAAILDLWHDPLAVESAPPPQANAAAEPSDGSTDETSETPAADLSPTALYRALADGLMAGDPALVQARYGFSIAPVTDERPYLAGYVKPKDIPRAIGHFDSLSDDWGFLLLIVSLGQSFVVGALLIALPLVFGWRTVFGRQPGKLGLLCYFACLGVGYILVEVTLIAKFVRALGNPTVSASIMLTGMLVMSGLGALISYRAHQTCRRILPVLLVLVAALLAAYAAELDTVIGTIAGLGDAGKMAAALAAAGAPAFFMGFALPTAMTELKRLGKEPFFLWAWGINGLFSTGAAVAAPLIGVVFGLDTALAIAAGCYLAAAPSYYGVLRPVPTR